MFTGIVVEQGRLKEITSGPEGAVLRVSCREVLDDLCIGSSISVDGCCLTVVEKDQDSFSVEATPETLRLTNLGQRSVNDGLNLEPSARLSDFLGGHLVQGHVDGVGHVESVREEGNSWVFRIRAPIQVLRYCTLKGSIAVNGVSLTISGLDGQAFEVTIIPHTFAVTNFGHLKAGDAVNLEADVISKYVESHVRRFLGVMTVILLLFCPGLRGADPEIANNSVLIYENEVAGKTSQFVVRVARFKPDLVMEWENQHDQGTVHIFSKALEEGREFTLTQLFEVGVDTEAKDRTTLLLPRKLYQSLKDGGSGKTQFNRLPMKFRTTGEESTTIRVDGQDVEIQALKVEDDRGGSWMFWDSAEAPLVLKYESQYYVSRLKSLTLTDGSKLRWIRKLPPIR